MLRSRAHASAHLALAQLRWKAVRLQERGFETTSCYRPHIRQLFAHEIHTDPC